MPMHSSRVIGIMVDMLSSPGCYGSMRRSSFKYGTSRPRSEMRPLPSVGYTSAIA